MRILFLCLMFLLLTSEACSQEINKDVLHEIKDKAKKSHSDAVIIVKNNETIYEDYFGQSEKPIYIASAGKSLVSMAIGKLIDKKLLDSLDQPVHSLYPEWKQGRKKDITIRMLLNHTSGLQNNPNASIELEPAPSYKVENIVKLALAAELANKPGEKAEYNNKAVALLGGIIEKASGKRLDEFFVEEFYKPMNIIGYDWIRDEDGNPTAHGALIIKPSDLLKFGQLILNKGIYNGKVIISESWIKESLKQSQRFTPIWGLLWWRLPEYEKRIINDSLINTWVNAGVDEKFIKKFDPIKNKLYETKNEYYEAVNTILGNNWYQVLNENLPANVDSSKKIFGKEVIAYYASGYRGNFLVIVPKHKIVAVRYADPDGFNYKTDFFNDFVNLVSRLNK